MAVQTFSAEEVSDIYDLRAHLESYAARRAAERVTASELDEMRRVQDELLAEAAPRARPGRRRLAARARPPQPALPPARRARRALAPLERVISGVGQTPLVYKAYLWYGDDEKRRSAEDHDAAHRPARRRRRARRRRTSGARHIEFGRGVLVERLNAQLSRSDAGF